MAPHTGRVARAQRSPPSRVDNFEIPNGVPEEAIKALREYIERELYSAGRGFVEAYAQNRKEEEEQGA